MADDSAKSMEFRIMGMTIDEIKQELARLDGPVRDCWRRNDRNGAIKLCAPLFEEIDRNSDWWAGVYENALHAMLSGGRLPSMVRFVDQNRFSPYAVHESHRRVQRVLTWGKFEEEALGSTSYRRFEDMRIVGSDWVVCLHDYDHGGQRWWYQDLTEPEEAHG